MPSLNINRACLLLLFLLAYVTSAPAQIVTVTLKDGKIIRGRTLRATPESITIDPNGQGDWVVLKSSKVLFFKFEDSERIFTFPVVLADLPPSLNVAAKTVRQIPSPPVRFKIGLGILNGRDHDSVVMDWAREQGFEGDAGSAFFNMSAMAEFRTIDHLYAVPAIHLAYSRIEVTKVWTYLNNYSQTESYIDLLLLFNLGVRYYIIESAHNVYAAASIGGSAPSSGLDGIRYSSDGITTDFGIGYQFRMHRGTIGIEIGQKSIPLQVSPDQTKDFGGFYISLVGGN